MANAQGVANNTAFGDWIVRCEAVTSTQTSCRAVQLLTRTEDQSLVARLIAVPNVDGGAIFLAQAPIGVFLPARPVLRGEGEDASNQAELTWQRCLGEICEAALGLTAEALRNLSAKGKVLFGYRMQRNSEPVVVRIDVSRLAEAIEAIGPAN